MFEEITEDKVISDDDDDFFTPVASTSLANVFGKHPTYKQKLENESLKYVPPKPQIQTPKPTEDSKLTSCVFACVVVAYEWIDNVYTSKGKLGFGIIKVMKTGVHNIVLYNSSKQTLSNLIASSKLVVTVKNNNYVSYYDNSNKYWSLYGSERDVTKIVELLRSFDVIIKEESSGEKTEQEPEADEKTKSILEATEKSSYLDLGSDTDSSLNKKAKASILSRMANVGQSVFPTTVFSDRTSDSSDNNEKDCKVVRHRPAKSNVKHKNMLMSQSNPEHSKHIVTSTVEENTEHSNQQFHSTPSASIPSASGTDLVLFISEQRTSNSELRVNMNRITDKVDDILGKINNFHIRDDTNINNVILQKLLKEYESKIESHEKLISSLKEDMKQPLGSEYNNSVMMNKIKDLENLVTTKDHDIKLLKSEIEELKNQPNRDKDQLMETVLALQHELLNQKTEYNTLHNQHNSKKGSEKTELANNLKSIMNDTFQTITTNLQDDESYTGSAIKDIIATIIKRITVETLNKL